MTEYISKKLKETLSALGPAYRIEEIDGEKCIYRKVNSNYEIEISGLNNSRESFTCTAYLRDMRLSNNGLIIQTLPADSLETLRGNLEQLLKTAHS